MGESDGAQAQLRSLREGAIQQNFFSYRVSLQLPFNIVQSVSKETLVKTQTAFTKKLTKREGWKFVFGNHEHSPTRCTNHPGTGFGIKSSASLDFTEVQRCIFQPNKDGEQ